MSRPALAASRGARIIDLLVAFPERRLSLTEIAHATHINRASCHAILSELESRGYLCRHGLHKTYWLGPALVIAGQPAMVANPILQRARKIAEELNKDLGLPVLLTTKIGDEVVCVFSLSDDAGHTAGLRPGDRFPLVPPIGMSFIAWSPPAEAKSWIARRVEVDETEITACLSDTLDLVRARGFHVTLRRPGAEDVASVLARAATNDGRFDPHLQLAMFVKMLDVKADQPDVLDTGVSYDVQLIASPVIDRETRSIYNLCIGGFSQRLAGTAIATLGHRLAVACLTIIADSD